MSISKIDFIQVEKALAHMNETNELAKHTLPSWGGKLEELYETVWARLNAAIKLGWENQDPTKEEGYIEQERHLTGLRDRLLENYPHLLIWAKANGLGNDQ